MGLKRMMGVAYAAMLRILYIPRRVVSEVIPQQVLFEVMVNGSISG